MTEKRIAKRGRRARFLAGLAILVGSVFIAVLLVILRPAPERVQPLPVSPLVTTVHPTAHEGHLTVRGYGTVRPLREITVVAEVSGKVRWVSGSLVAGGRFHTGELMLTIDPSDYENAVTVAWATVQQRRLDRTVAQEEMALARREWELLHTDADSTAPGRLASKEPQLRVAEAQVLSAEARLADAKARLGRTRITAPFNGSVRTKSVDLGQVVGPGRVLASFYGTDAVEIDVPLSKSEAALLGAAAGGGATVEAAGSRWNGVLHRTDGAYSEATRTLNAVVRVHAPYNVPALRVGTFVLARLEGVHLDEYFSVPCTALREGGVVWVVESERLRTRHVHVIQEAEGEVYLTGGVKDDDLVVVSSLAAMTNGMRVRTAVETGTR